MIVTFDMYFYRMNKYYYQLLLLLFIITIIISSIKLCHKWVSLAGARFEGTPLKLENRGGNSSLFVFALQGRIVSG